MCTERSGSEIVVCDVAIADVRQAVAGLDGVVITHLPYEGNLVALPDGSATVGRFRALVHEAIVPHGGALAGEG